MAGYLLVRRPWRRAAVGAGVAVVSGVVGWLVVWWFAGVQDVFGVGLTPVTTMWVCLAFAGAGLAVVNLFYSRWWRKTIAVISVPVFVAATAAGVNVDFGAYRNLNDALGVVPYKPLTLYQERGEVVSAGTDYAAPWASPSRVPPKGVVGSVRIPAAASKFQAREAVVYLPPAALTADPPVLPVLYAFSGQPGAPADVFTAGGIATVMDRMAAQNGGIAPIVVAADQLGGSEPESDVCEFAGLWERCNLSADRCAELGEGALPGQRRPGGMGSVRVLRRSYLRCPVRNRASGYFRFRAGVL